MAEQEVNAVLDSYNHIKITTKKTILTDHLKTR